MFKTEKESLMVAITDLGTQPIGGSYMSAQRTNLTVVIHVTEVGPQFDPAPQGGLIHNCSPNNRRFQDVAQCGGLAGVLSSSSAPSE